MYRTYSAKYTGQQDLGKLFDSLDNLLNIAQADYLDYYGRNATQLQIKEKEYVLELPVPGAEREDFDVEVVDKYLKVSYNPKNPNRFSKKFSYRWPIPEGNQEAVSASYVGGVLKVVVSKQAKEDKSVKVKVF